MSEQPTVPCGICGNPTPMLGTKRCDRCWELESRICVDPVLARRILKEKEQAGEDEGVLPNNRAEQAAAASGPNVEARSSSQTVRTDPASSLSVLREAALKVARSALYGCDGAAWYEVSRADMEALQAALASSEPVKAKVTRVEVIDHRSAEARHGGPLGRAFVGWDIGSVELSYQDGGRTLKIFLDDAEPNKRAEEGKP